MEGNRILVFSRTENLPGKRDFFKGRPKFLNGTSEWKMCVPFASFY